MPCISSGMATIETTPGLNKAVRIRTVIAVVLFKLKPSWQPSFVSLWSIFIGVEQVISCLNLLLAPEWLSTADLRRCAIACHSLDATAWHDTLKLVNTIIDLGYSFCLSLRFLVPAAYPDTL
ncbi:hypothetical protein M758_1G141900 [Ceratodon purpureus]|uniref:Uncharacterized protein n=1 Tax=Ceratodon purpureus TaxID=3225 RepID=A0A8T0J859_CERPU|nr:hypothetical protein KC19_1G145800 [Ceratodon purpureus]KAG0629949.1 hypothetical protein M758_1G141900 [Ceratodon purpureus]